MQYIIDTNQVIEMKSFTCLALTLLLTSTPLSNVVSNTGAPLLIGTNVSREETITRFWQLTFIKDLPIVEAPTIPIKDSKPADGAGGGGGATGGDGCQPKSGEESPPNDKGDSLVKALEAAINCSEVKITRVGDGLSLTGPKSKVILGLSLLARYIDISPSQVKLDVFAFQLNEQLHLTKNLVPKMEIIKHGVSKVRLYQQYMTSQVSAFVSHQDIDAGLATDTLDNLVCALKKVGLIDESEAGTPDKILKAAKARPMSLIETLVFATVIERANLRKEFREFLCREDGILAMIAGDIATQRELMSRKKGQERIDAEYLLNLYQSIQDQFTYSPRSVFNHTLSFFGNEATGGDVKTLTSFLNAWTDKDEEPTVVRTKSFVIDLMIQQISNAMNQDMKALFTDPLLGWSRGLLMGGGGSSRGINYLGHISVAASNRQPVTYAGVATSTRKLTSFDSIIAKKASEGSSTSKADSGSTAATDDKKSGSSLGDIIKNSFGGSVTPQLDLLFKAVEGQKEQFYSIAPGISFGARPIVMADGSTANLELQLLTAASASDGTGSNVASRFDSIQLAPLKTTVQVSAFDFFQLSSFGMQTATKGDPRWEIPGLSGIPIIGSIFRGPSGTDRRQQEVVMFISVAIVPRAIDLTSRYGG
jgi:hypothetical protein